MRWFAKVFAMVICSWNRKVLLITLKIVTSVFLVSIFHVSFYFTNLIWFVCFKGSDGPTAVFNGRYGTFGGDQLAVIGKKKTTYQ